MESRMNYEETGKGILQAMYGLERYIRACGIEERLVYMIKVRASQMNGCAYCIDMHWKDARAVGENEQRLYGLDAWRESPFYSDRERAALEWTEAITFISSSHVPDELYEEVRKHFTEKELADLTFIVATINTWNRLVIPARVVPGTYEPAKAASTSVR